MYDWGSDTKLGELGAMGGTLLQDFIPHGATRDPFPLVYSHDPASIHSYELGYVQVEAVAHP